MERITIVMGGATELGSGIAARLVEADHLVAILDGDARRIARVEPDYDPGVALLFALDPLDTEETAEVLEAVDERFGVPTGLVIVLDPPDPEPIGVVPPEEIVDRLLAPVAVAALLVRQVAETMDEGGAVVLVLSPDETRSTFAETLRAAFPGLVAGLAADLGPDVRVTGVAPATAAPVPRTARDPLADFVLFLLTDAGAALGGQVFRIG